MFALPFSPFQHPEFSSRGKEEVSNSSSLCFHTVFRAQGLCTSASSLLFPPEFVGGGWGRRQSVKSRRSGRVSIPCMSAGNLGRPKFCPASALMELTAHVELCQ